MREAPGNFGGIEFRNIARNRLWKDQSQTPINTNQVTYDPRATVTICLEFQFPYTSILAFPFSLKSKETNRRTRGFEIKLPAT